VVTRDDRRYARFYYPEFIRDYPTVYHDDAAFAAWMRLLVVAEQMWPLSMELPRSVRPKALRVLVEAGLVATDGAQFALKGLDAERTRRRESGRKGAAVRWDSEGNANASANAMPSPSTSKAEQEIPLPHGVGRRKDGTNPRAQGTNPRATGTSPRQERQAAKRQPTKLHEILSAIQTGREP
jgi:hypothetical protein